ncbi:MAG: phosphoenolpyruvate--protein phosphotransferase [Spirochaetaceae bacterium]
MREIRGISVSPGIAIGKAFIYVDDFPKIPEYEIDASAVEDEVSRLHAAVASARGELDSLRDMPGYRSQRVHQELLDSHVLMLEDPDYLGTIEKRVRNEQCNVERALSAVTNEYLANLNARGSRYLRERSADLQDVCRRIMNHLLYREHISLVDLQEPVVLVAHDLLPSVALTIPRDKVLGIAMDAGGRTSHTAILARAFEIPTIVGCKDISSRVRWGDEVVVDANRGMVVVRPDEESVEHYIEVQAEWKSREAELLGQTRMPAVTTDGLHLKVMANIEVPDEVESVISHGADGVGLYRSEFLFLSPGRPPTEDEQCEAYASVLTAMGDKPVTIRTLDVGGDKVVPELAEIVERNPILGWRAIRFSLGRKDLFRRQLRALYRASVRGKLRIMFPMISGIEEVWQVYEIIESVKAELTAEGIPFDPDVPLGIMIEVPSAAMTADILAKEVAFFSIGTNDLIQYTLAVDRGNEKIAYLYEPFHPGVLRLLKKVIDAAKEAAIPVALCGEMAGDPVATVVLLGLGVDEFSMSSALIPEVKRILRVVSRREAVDVVETVMGMRSFREVDSFIAELMERQFDVRTT